MMPDIVFNPHGFPSRMTIAMMVECMAGKSGAGNLSFIEILNLHEGFNGLASQIIQNNFYFSSWSCS